MSDMNRCGLASSRNLGAIDLSLASNDADTQQRLAALYAGFVETDSAKTDSAKIDPARCERAATVEVRLDLDEAASAPNNAWVGTIDGVVVRKAEHRIVVEDALTRRINRVVLDAETDRLHLHAGAVHRDGVTVLVVGTSGAGKSTLIATLVAAGWQYLSDEQLGVLSGGLVVPYPRPITLRRNSWALLDVDVDPTWPDSIERLELAPGQLGNVYGGPPVAPTLIVCPDINEPAGSARLSASQTVAKLLVDTMDLERSASAGFDALLDVATAAPAWRVGGKDLAATLALIDQWSASATGAPERVESIGPGDSSTTGASAWLFSDDTAVIYDPSHGALVSIDASGYHAWKLVLGPRDEWPAELAESSFVADLIEAGVLTLEGNHDMTSEA